MSHTFLFCAFVCTAYLFPQTPKHEVRAVWLSVTSGDWPASFDVEEQKRSLIEILDILKKNNFNTVFFQVRPRGNTLYKSDIEPWAKQLTGILGKDPGWDPLQFAIDETRKRGMELHAWFNVAKVWGADSPPSRPEHIVNKHRNWVRQVDNEWWIDMGNPAVREYTERVVMELVEKYDVDGIHFDFVRYPNESFDDWFSFSTWSDGMERSEWRRNNITQFVRDCYERIHSIKPWVKIGSAPVGIYQAVNGAQSTFTGFESVFQDSRLWLRAGIHDYIVPQIYWSIGEQQNPNDPDFIALCNDWARENYGRHVYAGIGIYRDNVHVETRNQVLVSRIAGMSGQSYFRYSFLNTVLQQLNSVYNTPALISPMVWKDSIPPLPPKNISFEVTAEYANIIKWSESEAASDGETPFRYIVYRSTSEPVNTHSGENIAAVLPADKNIFIDEEGVVSGKKYFYTVTTVDRCWNESISTIPVVETESIVSRLSIPKQSPILSEGVLDSSKNRLYISFELPRESDVKFTLKHTVTQKESVIVNGLKNAGIHIVAVDLDLQPAGTIEYTLKTDNGVITKQMENK